jgi:hypothetical protein
MILPSISFETILRYLKYRDEMEHVEQTWLTRCSEGKYIKNHYRFVLQNVL